MSVKMSSVIDQILLVLEVAKDTPPPPAPDYTPAFIGIGGVVIGGLIQTAFGFAKMRDDQAQALRTSVAVYCHDADAYVGRMMQYSDLAKSGDMMQKSVQYRTDAVKEITVMYRTLRASSYKLLASTDTRIATAATDLSADIARCSKKVEDIFGDPPAANDKRDWPEWLPLVRRINELATMVEPQWYEKHSRFRSLVAARKLVGKQTAEQLKRRSTPEPWS